MFRNIYNFIDETLTCRKVSRKFVSISRAEFNWGM